MTWSTAAADLRVLLSDGPTDKLCAYKSVFGTQDGTNTTFKTFEFRRITDFSSSATSFPLGLYINGQRLASSGVTVDDPDTGYFTAASAYSDAVSILATYYIQWFTDVELTGFLTRSSDWLGLGDDYSNIPSGLKTAALKYAAHEAYQKLSLLYARNVTETYRLEDAPDDRKFQVVSAYQKAAADALKEAERYRDDYYTRKGQYKAPLFGTIQGNIKNPTIG